MIAHAAKAGGGTDEWLLVEVAATTTAADDDDDNCWQDASLSRASPSRLAPELRLKTQLLSSRFFVLNFLPSSQVLNPSLLCVCFEAGC